jgi:tripartite-type tricarboxylate transporter receptor subunit TctC
MTILGRLAALGVALCISWAASAQTYPSKPIRIVCAFPVGGIADLYARIIGQRVAASWGQPVVVENRTGAGGTIAAETVAKSPADGYTLVMGAVGTHAVNISLFAKLPYDPVKDFAAIALVLEAEGLLVVHPSVAANNVAELIALARAKPGVLKIEMTHVPYKGNVPAITDPV